MFKKTQILFLLVCTTYFASSVEEANDTLKNYYLPSITVTSTRAIRGETPIPFSEIHYKDFVPIYTTQDIPRILSETPSIISFSHSGNDIGYSNLTMRGFDQRRIAVLINGIPQNDPEDHNVYWIDFPDFLPNVQQIQIQRGAGLNNYGQAAIGGSINLNTGNFLNKKGVRLYTGIGWQEFGYNDNSTKLHPNVSKFSIEFSSGLVDNQAFYGRLSRVNSLGYRNHSFAFLNSYFFSYARFDKNISTQINVFGGPINDGLAYNGLPKDYIKDKEKRRYNWNYWVYDSSGKKVDYFSERRNQEIEEFSQPHYEILNDWQITNNLRFLSALFYYTGDGFFDYDASWADTSMLRLTSEYGYSLSQNPTGTIFRAFVGNKQGGWIPRIVWNHGNNELTVGAEIRFHRSEHWGKIRYAEYLPTNYNPEEKVYSNNGVRDIVSLFARETIKPNNKLSISLEGQINYQRYALKNEKARNKPVYFRDINGNIVGGENYLFDIKYLFFNPRVGINYKQSENISFFGFVAYTSREPRMHNLYRADDSYFGAKPQFNFQRINDEIRYDFSKPNSKPEKMLDIELGANFKLFEKVETNINLFWMDYKDELVKTGRLDIFGNPVEENIPETNHSGLEFELSARIFEGEFGNLSFKANFTISSNRITNYNFITYDSTIISFKNNRIAGFPDFLGNFRINYSFENLLFSLWGHYVGNYRTDNYDKLITENNALINHLRQLGDYYTDNILDDYFVLNLDINYTFKKLIFFNDVILKVQVKNLLNRLYAAGAEGKEFFPAAERSYFLSLELGF
ncbi:MAG: TonB-dependent receptor plug domain-containing protein [Ignavibacteria bacterium]|nr:TonB-dependent receptor plug domain-containing protein [Ignavibacteria bacterium]